MTAPRGEPSSVTATAVRPVSARRRPAGSAIVAEARMKTGGCADAVVRGDAAQPAQHLGDVRAEDAAVAVALVDDHEPQAAEEPRQRAWPGSSAAGAACPDWSARSWRAPAPRRARRAACRRRSRRRRTPREAEVARPPAAGRRRAPWWARGRARCRPSRAPRDSAGQQVGQRLAGRGAGGDDHVASRAGAASAACAWCAHGRVDAARARARRPASRGPLGPGGAVGPVAGGHVLDVGAPGRAGRAARPSRSRERGSSSRAGLSCRRSGDGRSGSRVCTVARRMLRQ